ncbi:MAG: leucine-rich repeat domain-containing protein [Oscillospiraceae bacterium]|nr:leucine-rich repeat domain-containing protein [Oscillospiraceae bacterium]
MKKVICIIITIILLSACGQNNFNSPLDSETYAGNAIGAEPTASATSTAESENSVPEPAIKEYATVCGVHMKMGTRPAYYSWIDENLSDDDILDFKQLPNWDNIESISLRKNQITDLSPIAHLTNLKELDLSENPITDLTPIANFTNLTKLYINETQISDLTPLANLAKLKELCLADNQITDISPLKNLSDLEQLDLKNNQISNLPSVLSLKQLDFISLDNNNVEDISPLSSLKNLSNVRLQNNNIEDISALSKLPDLRRLNIGDNKIKDISALSRLSDLSYLYISGNEITDFSPLSRLPGLTNDYTDIDINLEDFWVYEKSDKCKEIENMTDEELIEIANAILNKDDLPQMNIPDFYMPDAFPLPLGNESWTYFNDTFSSREAAVNALREHIAEDWTDQDNLPANGYNRILSKFIYLGENDYYYHFYFEIEHTFAGFTGGNYTSKVRMLMFKDSFISAVFGRYGSVSMTLKNVPDKDSVLEILDMITFLEIRGSYRGVPPYIHREIQETEDEYIYTLYYVGIGDMDWGLPLIAYLSRRDIYVNKLTGDIAKRDEGIKNLDIPGTSM